MLRTISMNKNCTWNINYIGKNYKHFCEVFQHKKTEPFPCLSSKQTLHIHSSSLHYVRVSLLQYVHMDNRKKIHDALNLTECRSMQGLIQEAHL